MPPKRGRGRGRGGGDRQPQERVGEQRPQERIGERQPQQRVAPPGFQEAPQTSRGPERDERAVPPKQALEDLGLQFQHKMLVSTPLPRKPDKKAVMGRPIQLKSNCYAIDLPNGNVYHYDVEILNKRQSSTTTGEPGPVGGKEKADTKYRCMSTKRNREIIEAMMAGKPQFKNVFAAYDGRKNMYTRVKMSFIQSDEFKCEVVMPDENPGNPNDPRGPRNETFQVHIKPVKKKETNDCAISLDPLHALFRGHVTSVPQEAIMAIETVLRHGPCLRYVPVGRSFFYPPTTGDVHPLGGGREIWFGYHQSLRLGQWKPMVNLDITATTFYQKKPVIEYVADILKKDIHSLSQVTLRDGEIQHLSKSLKTMRIEVTHLRNYRRKYRILRFTRESADRLRFDLTENGVQVTRTVAEYFRRQHNYQLQYPNLPCIQANPETKRVYLPIEVCEMVEGQHCKKKLEERQNSDMIKITSRAPKQRFNEIAGIFDRADFSRDRYLREFGIKVHPKPLMLEGRVLEAPNVLYLKNSATTKVKPVDGSWDMRNKQYFRPAVINSWVLLSFSNPRFCPQNQLERFAKMLHDIASEQGISIQRPASIESINPRQKLVQDVLSGMQKKFNVNLAVVVVPGNDKTMYGQVKQAAETCLGLQTQCIKDENVVKKLNPPLVSNLCQKINAKMGGVNNALTPGETPEILRRPVIIIGADVTHPSPSQDIKPSLAAAVGSLDAHPSRYAVTIRAQTNIDEKKQAVEIILELKAMVLELLKAFYKHTRGKKPEKIIFYRDGVSEGQFEAVRDHEVKCIREACKELNPEYQPGITFIVVQKRHHTRFMPQDDRQGTGRMRNIPPGTTVDSTVTHPLNFDFFLCSHFGLQGTSRPCHYTVIADDNEFSADDLHKLTYYLCHTYVRCTKSISSPAPVMYAHLAAFRARQHLLSHGDESSASSTISAAEYHPLPDEILGAIKIKEELKSSMYYV